MTAHARCYATPIRPAVMAGTLRCLSTIDPMFLALAIGSITFVVIFCLFALAELTAVLGADALGDFLRDAGQQVGGAGALGAAGAAGAGGANRGPAPGASHRTYEGNGSYTDWYNADNPPPGIGMTPGTTAGIGSDGTVTVKLGNGDVVTYPPGWGNGELRLQRDDSPDKTNPGGARSVQDTLTGVYTVDDAPADGSVPSYGPVSH